MKNELIPKKNNDLRKASGALQIEHKVTINEQRVWNILLANAYSNLPYKKEFSVNMREIMHYFEYEDYTHIQESIKALVGTVVEYNLFEKDKKVWGCFTLLSGAEIKDGFCTYRYDQKLQEKLQNPEIYARINLEIQSKFTCKYSLFLYELCVDYKGVCQTPMMKLDDFKRFMGIDRNEYSRFNNLQSRVIEPAVEEINKYTDLQVSTALKHKGRRVVEIQFKIGGMAGAAQLDFFNKFRVKNEMNGS